MSYVIYNTQTWRTIGKHYETERAAKSARTKLLKKQEGDNNDQDWAVDTYQNYHAKMPMVETHNMLNPNGGVVMIRACDKGGCCDPATESYHSC